MKYFLRNKLLLLITMLLAEAIVTQAQTKVIDKSLKKKLEAANYYFQFDNFHLALPILLEIYAIDSTIPEVTFKTGVCMYNIKRNKTEAQKYFEKTLNEYIDSYYYLGNIYHFQMLFDKAIANFQYYKFWYGKKTFTWEETDHLINNSTSAKKMVRFPVRANIRNMGNTVNSLSSDYVPLITSDETTMFFTSRREGSTGNLKDPLGEYFEDIYVTHKTDTSWTPPQNIGSPINTPGHDACVAISADGYKMFIYRTSKNLEGGNIFQTEYNGKEWSEPKKINAEINTKTGIESSGTISPDDNVFYFSSNRAGGYGGKDLYRVIKFPNGNWSKAMNLGPSINTQFDEDAPFIHPDGKTLFFSSRGHENMGGYDVFKSISNEEGEWTTPENIGYPINTVFDDLFFVITADNMRGYYSCDREGNGNSDIYEIDMPENLSSYKLLRGVIYSDDSIPQTLKAFVTITLIDNETNTLQGVYRTNKESGKYLLIVEPKKKYKVIIEAEDFENLINEIEIPAKVDEQIINKDMKLRRKRK